LIKPSHVIYDLGHIEGKRDAYKALDLFMVIFAEVPHEIVSSQTGPDQENGSFPVMF
jgi:hypothetical protein